MFDVRCVLLRNTTGPHNKFYAMVLLTYGEQAIIVKNYGPIGKSGVTNGTFTGRGPGRQDYESVWGQKVSKKGYLLLDEYNFSDELTPERIRNIKTRLGLSAEGIAKLVKFADPWRLTNPRKSLEDPGAQPESAIENAEIDKTTQYDTWASW